MRKIVPLVIFVVLILNFNFGSAQLFKEDFNGDLYGWSFVNNSSAIGDNSKGWMYGNPKAPANIGDFNSVMDVRNAFSGTNPNGTKNTYLFVGFNYGSDVQGSTLSKWAITPMIRVKNGDKIRFRTRQRSTACNNANKLEVRLSSFRTSTEAYSNYDSTLYLNSGANSVGNFTNLIGEINPSLNKTGTGSYPNEWTIYEFEVTGLATNEYYFGRIGFRYIIPNAGTSSCVQPFSIPSVPTVSSSNPMVNMLVTSGSFTLGEVCEECGAVLDAYDGIAAAVDYSNQVLQNLPSSSAVNGSAIGIDDFEVVPRENVFMYDATNLPANVRRKVFDTRNLTNNELFRFGTKGEEGCQINAATPMNRRFTVYNGTSVQLKLKPKVTPKNGAPANGILLSTNDSITVPAFSYASVTLNLNSAVAYGIYQYDFSFTNKNNQVIAKTQVELLRNGRGRPTAICKNVSLELGQNGTASLSGGDVNNGSVNGCGGTDKLAYIISKSYTSGALGPWDYGNNTFTCADVGSQFVRLIVQDSIGGSDNRAECYATINVINNNHTPIDETFQQNFYIGSTLVQKNMMPVASIVKPPVINGCMNATPELFQITYKKPNETDYVSYPLNTPMEVGQYKLNWKVKVGNTYIWGGGITRLNVIDTVKPFLTALDTTLIGFTDFVYDEVTQTQYSYVKTTIKGEDLCLQYSYDNSYGYNGSHFRDYRGIVDYEISTPSYNGGAWVNEIPFTCAQSGTKFPVSVRAYDASGNFRVLTKYVKILSPSNPSCKNIEVELNTWFTSPTVYVTGEQVLDVGSTMACGFIQNVTISKSQFTCAEMGQTIPVTVTYTTNQNVQGSCVGSVKVKPFALSQTACRDTTIYADAGLSSQYPLVVLPQAFNTACSYYLPVNTVASGATNFSVVSGGLFQRNLAFGHTQISRSIVYNGQTISCSQDVMVVDTTRPILSLPAPQDVTINMNYNNFSCIFEHEIVNCFEQSKYSFWGYEITGQIDTTAIFRKAFFAEQDWLNKTIQLEPGVYHIKVFAEDFVGNRRELSYTFNYNLIGTVPPYIRMDEFEVNNTNFQGQECSDIHNFHIECPVEIQCNQAPVMWFFQVRDYSDNILYELDSIPATSGADIPVQVGNMSGLSFQRYIHFGHHESTWKILHTGRNYSVSFIDQVNTITCPRDTVIYSNNNTTLTADFEILSPVSACAGSFWGYSVTGETTLKTNDLGLTYTNNQVYTLTNNNYQARYPSNLYDQNKTVALNKGVNTVTYSYIEPSGNGQISGCSFKVTVFDTTSPSMTCPSDDTIHRSDLGSCTVAGLQNCQQISGFTGPYGTGRYKIKGGNTLVRLETDAMPASLTLRKIFLPSNPDLIDYNDGYIQLKANCNGTISFNYEYQSDVPSLFRPFIKKSEGTNLFTGYSSVNTGVITGSVSISVNVGEIINIGVMEAGLGYNGYFTISNLSGPYAAIVSEIEQPIFAVNDKLFFEENVQAEYPIGNHQITYRLTNLNNNKLKTCVQDLVVIDDHAGSLACHDTTVHLDQDGSLILQPSDLISTCFDVSNTWMTMDTLSCADVGSHVVTINSYDNTNQLLSCNFNLTVIDNLGPRLLRNVQNIELNTNGDNATLSEAQMIDMLQDPCGIQSVTASRTNFACSDANRFIPVKLTATDVHGNQSVLDIYVNVTISGFNENSAISEDYTVCQGTSVNLLENSVGNDFKYYWKKKDKIYDSLSWNYYSFGPNIPAISSDHVYKFVKDIRLDNLPTVKKASYLTTRDPINIYELDTIKQTWEPTDIPTLNVSGGYTLLKGHNEDLYVLLYDLNDSRFKMYQYNYWSTFTWTDVTPQEMWAGNFYGNDDYRFMVDGFGIVRAFSSAYVTYPYMNFYTAPFNGGWGTISVLENAQNIVGLRNGLGENRFFKINLDAYGNMTHTKDSLTVDPTDNSSLFKMHSLNNEAYIAYKSSNGKICVKKFDGSSSWSAVGSLDFSNGTVNKIDISSYDDTLYVTYSEVTNQIVVKKFNGTNWELVNSPNDNLGPLSTNNFKFVNVTDKPQIYIPGALGGLVSREGWSNINSDTNPFTTNSFTPQTNLPGTETYRCEITNGNTCARIISGEKTVTVNELPIMNDHDFSTTNPNSVLTTTTNVGTINWSVARDGSDIFKTGNTYQLDNLTEDTAFYAFAINDICSSDTVKFTVFLNDTEIPDLNFTYQDTICNSGNDGNEIIIDTLDGTYIYSVYKKNANGDFEFFQGPNYQSVVWPGITETGTYKILVEEPKVNHYASDGNNEYLKYENVQLSLSDELTIEGWFNVAFSVNPAFNLALAHGNSNNINDNSELKNFEWHNGQFTVHNGASSRSLAFPDLPGTFQWVHVSTVAGPNGMKIYYNGVLVASNNLTSNEAINRINSPLIILKSLNDQTAPSCIGLDEIKIWRKERTEIEISEAMNSCIGEYEDDLILFTDFDKFNLVTKQFESVIGSSAKEFGRGPYANPLPQGYRTEDVCGDTTISKKFLPEFEVKVLPYSSDILLSQDYPYNGNEIETCGGVSAPVFAQPNGGIVYWYDAQYDGNLLGTGNFFNFYSDKDTAVYAKSVPSKFCYGTRVSIDIMEYPQILSVTHDTICIGNDYSYVNINVDLNETGNFSVYTSEIGGTPFDYRNDYTVLTENDTLWLEAYNDYCTAPSRVPFYIYLFKEVDLNFQNYSFCEEGQVDYVQTTPNVELSWFEQNEIDQIGYTVFGETFATSTLTDTTVFKVRAYNYEHGCYANMDSVVVNVTNLEHRDTILSCNPITWRNGETYYNSTNELVYRKTNAGTCDSIYYLNLKVSDLQNRYVLANASGACIGQRVDFTIYGTQVGKSYVLVDLISGDTLNRIIGNGSNQVIQTTPLTVDMNVKVVAIDSLINPNDLLVCEKELGTFELKAGESIAITNIITCDDYTWRGQTYTESGTYTETLTSVYGCDSILQLNLTINNSYNNTINVTACQSYTWHGTTYTSSQQVVRQLGFTRFGCDSTQTLNLTIGAPNTGIATVSACGSYTWIDGNTYTSSNNTATHVLSNQYGCDSTVTLNLTIHNSNTGIATISLCGSYTWIDGVTYTSNNNTATYVLTNQNGCDSTVTLNLTINPIPTLTATSASRYGSGSLTISATPSSGATLKWYDATENGTEITHDGTNYSISGNQLTIHNLTSTSTFYVEAVDGSCVSATRTPVEARIYIPGLKTCGQTLAQLNAPVRFTYIPDIKVYRYEITGPGVNQVLDRYYDSTITLSSISGIQYSSTYSIRVRCLSMTNEWSAWGPACSVNTPAEPKLSGANCGSTITLLTQILNVVELPLASIYRIKLQKVGEPSFQTIDRYQNNERFTLSMFTGVESESVYEISVAILTPGMSRFSPFGSICTVTYIEPELTSTSCQNPIVSTSQILEVVEIPTATMYRIKLQKVGSPTSQTIDRYQNNERFTLSMFTGLEASTNYEISVAAWFGGTTPLSPYGSICTITTPGTIGLAQDNTMESVFVEEQTLTVFPNPNNGTFTASASQPGDFILLNSLGQIIQHISLTEENLKIEITNLSSGMYFLSGTVDGQQLIEKVVVE